MGTYLRELSYPIYTNTRGFRWFSKIFAYICPLNESAPSIMEGLTHSWNSLTIIMVISLRPEHFFEKYQKVNIEVILTHLATLLQLFVKIMFISRITFTSKESKMQTAIVREISRHSVIKRNWLHDVEAISHSNHGSSLPSVRDMHLRDRQFSHFHSYPLYAQCGSTLPMLMLLSSQAQGC